MHTTLQILSHRLSLFDPCNSPVRCYYCLLVLRMRKLCFKDFIELSKVTVSSFSPNIVVHFGCSMLGGKVNISQQEGALGKISSRLSSVRAGEECRPAPTGACISIMATLGGSKCHPYRLVFVTIDTWL